ncbi:hypothetical protein [Fimbriiglobus ruber]|uniref:hypothetical protein n=1 Tax=Fimbriiglobus ruber TaxID=1908690 RepID=UPI000B4B4553
MYYTGIDPFTKKPVAIAKGLNDRKMQRALMQFSQARELLRGSRRAHQGGPGGPDRRVRRAHRGAAAEGSAGGPEEASECGRPWRPLPHRREPGEGGETRGAGDGAGEGNGLSSGA